MLNKLLAKETFAVCFIVVVVYFIGHLGYLFSFVLFIIYNGALKNYSVTISMSQVSDGSSDRSLMKNPLSYFSFPTSPPRLV